jgi:hypothetical protein
MSSWLTLFFDTRSICQLLYQEMSHFAVVFFTRSSANRFADAVHEKKSTEVGPVCI